MISPNPTEILERRNAINSNLPHTKLKHETSPAMQFAERSKPHSIVKQRSCEEKKTQIRGTSPPECHVQKQTLPIDKGNEVSGYAVQKLMQWTDECRRSVSRFCVPPYLYANFRCSLPFASAF